MSANPRTSTAMPHFPRPRPLFPVEWAVAEIFSLSTFVLSWWVLVIFNLETTHKASPDVRCRGRIIRDFRENTEASNKEFNEMPRFFQTRGLSENKKARVLKTQLLFYPVGRERSERLTNGLKVRCSTDWANDPTSSQILHIKPERGQPHCRRAQALDRLIRRIVLSR